MRENPVVRVGADNRYAREVKELMDKTGAEVIPFQIPSEPTNVIPLASSIPAPF